MRARAKLHTSPVGKSARGTVQRVNLTSTEAPILTSTGLQEHLPVDLLRQATLEALTVGFMSVRALVSGIFVAEEP